MGKNDLPHAVSVLCQVLSFVAFGLGKGDAAIYIMLNAILIQLVVGNMKD